MSENRLQRIQDLFHRTENLSQVEQAAMLDEECGSNESLRREVEKLLCLPATEVDDFVQTLAFGVDDSSENSETPVRVGHYEIIRRIGEGGMGVVYLAQQQVPIRRQVALKLIKRGMDSEQTIARFEAERQALAMFDHPHVAKVFDAGFAEDGRPYFALEYVEGLPITKYCDQHNLSITDRLKLFIKVCEAIQHAHQKGVIHRDIKPSNILVSPQRGKAIPKVIDFGLAKALDHRLSKHTVYTIQGQLIGTPEYMSPEQAGSTDNDIDTRTDIYSLGVLLYELLVGTLPFDPTDLRRAPLGEIGRIIREDEPPKPSWRMSSNTRPQRASSADNRLRTKRETGIHITTIADHRSTDPRSLTKIIAGDLDWITMKSLEKDRSRRYTNASDLAADIQRYLHHEPVTAGAPSFTYRLKKFVRRNRLSVLAGSAMVLFFIVAAGLVFKFALAEASQRRLAENATQRAQVNLTLAEQRQHETKSAIDQLEAVVEIQSSMISDINAETMGRHIFTSLSERTLEKMIRSGASQDQIDAVLASFDELNATDIALNIVDKEILAGAVATIDADFADQPLLEAALRQAIGNTYRDIGLFPQSLPQLERALAIRRQMLGHDKTDTLDSINDMGMLLMSMGKYDEALPYCREALEGQRQELGDDHPDTLISINNTGTLLLNMGRISEAEPYFREALETRARILGDDHPHTLTSISNLGMLLFSMGKHDEAVSYSRKALIGKRQLLGNDHPSTLSSISNMGITLQSIGKYAEALPFHREALEGRRRLMGDDHPSTLTSINNVGYVLYLMDKYSEALAYQREALEGFRRVLGDDHPSTLSSISIMGTTLQAMDKLAEALPFHREALEGSRRVLGENHPETLGYTNKMGYILYSMDEFSEALPYYRKAEQAYRDVLGDEHPNSLQSRSNVGATLTKLGRHQEADAVLEAMEAKARRVWTGDNMRWLGAYLAKLGDARTHLGKFKIAETTLLESHELLTSSFGKQHWRTAKCVKRLVTLYESWNKLDKAAEWQATLPE